MLADDQTFQKRLMMMDNKNLNIMEDVHKQLDNRYEDNYNILTKTGLMAPPDRGKVGSKGRKSLLCLKKQKANQINKELKERIPEKEKIKKKDFENQSDKDKDISFKMLEEGSYQNRHMYTNKPNKLLKELTSEKEQKGRRFSEKLQKGRRFSEKLNFEDKDNRYVEGYSSEIDLLTPDYVEEKEVKEESEDKADKERESNTLLYEKKEKQKHLNVEAPVMEVDGEKNPDGLDPEGKEKDHTSSIIEVPGCTKEQLVPNQNKDPENYKPVSADEGFLLPSAVEMENLLQHAATVYGRCHSGGQGQSHTGSGPNSSQGGGASTGGGVNGAGGAGNGAAGYGSGQGGQGDDSGDGHERRPYNGPGPANCDGEKSSPKNKVATKRLHGRLDDLEMAQALQMICDPGGAGDAANEKGEMNQAVQAFASCLPHCLEAPLDVGPYCLICSHLTAMMKLAKTNNHPSGPLENSPWTFVRQIFVYASRNPTTQCDDKTTKFLRILNMLDSDSVDEKISECLDSLYPTEIPESGYSESLNSLLPTGLPCLDNLKISDSAAAAIGGAVTSRLATLGEESFQQGIDQPVSFGQAAMAQPCQHDETDGTHDDYKREPPPGRVVYGGIQQVTEFADQCENPSSDNEDEGVLIEGSMTIQNGHYSREKQWWQYKHLGSGRFGNCYLGADKETNKSFCVKKITRDDFSVNEPKILARLNHPHVIKFLGLVRCGSWMYIFTELALSGSLNDFIKEREKLNSRSATRISQQILEGLVCLQDQHVIHEDLKADNILLHCYPGGSLHACIGDFGLSQFLGDADIVPANQHPVGAQTHWSKEKAQSKAYDYRSDVWAAMCTVIHMLTGQPPWVARYPDAGTLILIIAWNPPPLEDVPQTVHPLIRGLIEQGLKENPEERPFASKLLQHPVFTMLEENPELLSLASTMEGSTSISAASQSSNAEISPPRAIQTSPRGPREGQLSHTGPHEPMVISEEEESLFGEAMFEIGHQAEVQITSGNEIDEMVPTTVDDVDMEEESMSARAVAMSWRGEAESSSPGATGGQKEQQKHPPCNDGAGGTMYRCVLGYGCAIGDIPDLPELMEAVEESSARSESAPHQVQGAGVAFGESPPVVPLTVEEHLHSRPALQLHIPSPSGQGLPMERSREPHTAIPTEGKTSPITPKLRKVQSEYNLRKRASAAPSLEVSPFDETQSLKTGLMVDFLRASSGVGGKRSMIDSVSDYHLSLLEADDMNDVEDDDEDDDETGADDDNFSMEELSFAQNLAFSGGSPQTPGVLIQYMNQDSGVEITRLRIHSNEDHQWHDLLPSNEIHASGIQAYTLFDEDGSEVNLTDTVDPGPAAEVKVMVATAEDDGTNWSWRVKDGKIDLFAPD